MEELHLQRSLRRSRRRKKCKASDGVPKLNPVQEHMFLCACAGCLACFLFMFKDFQLPFAGIHAHTYTHGLGYEGEMSW